VERITHLELKGIKLHEIGANVPMNHLFNLVGIRNSFQGCIFPSKVAVKTSQSTVHVSSITKHKNNKQSRQQTNQNIKEKKY